MKNLFYILIICISIISCKQNEKEIEVDKTNDEASSQLTLEGTWELVGFYNYVNNKVSDSFNPSTGYRQVKMYTPTKVMWSKNVPNDSTEWFGFGSYNLNNNELVEVLDYGSEMMKKIIDEKKEFKYELNLEKNKFSQIEIDEDGNRIYSENYKRIE